MNLEINYPKIEVLIEEVFNEYFKEYIKPLKYFYFDEDFFKRYLDLEYSHICINDELKEDINKYGRNYFESNAHIFKINFKSRRNNYEITAYKSLFTGLDCKKIDERKDYIEEYVLYHILLKLQSEAKYEIKKIIDIQLKNFISTYIVFLIDYGKPMTPPWDSFRPAIYQQRFTDLLSDIDQRIEKIEELIIFIDSESDDLFDKETFTDVYEFFKACTEEEKIPFTKQFRKINELNKLYDKIKKLYIHNDFSKKLDFVYSYPDDSNKEVIKTILDHSELSDLKFDGKDIAFYRGQSDSTWDIKASIVRDKGHLDSEYEMFYEILSLKPNEFEGDFTVYEKLITMQHFELPTRLLDLSRNPLISLYFACSYNFDKDGALYIFQENKDEVLNFEHPVLDCLTKIVNSKNGNVCSECLKENCPAGDEQVLGRLNGSCNILQKSYVVKGVAKNQRINNQSGDFIFVGLGENGKKCKNGIDQKPSKIIVLDSTLKLDLLNDLSSLNIHGGTIYPDLTNMSRYIKSSFSIPNKTPSIHENNIAIVDKFLSSSETKSEDIESSDLEQVQDVNNVMLFSNPDRFKYFTTAEIKQLKERFISGEIKDANMLGQEIKSLLSEKDHKLSDRRKIAKQAISKA